MMNVIVNAFIITITSFIRTPTKIDMMILIIFMIKMRRDEKSDEDRHYDYDNANE